MIRKQKILKIKANDSNKNFPRKSLAIALSTFVILLVCCSLQLSASDWTCVVKLKGYWKFSVGDDKKWANPDYNDTNWDQIYVPAPWEDAYPDYNGYAWYRKTFTTKWVPDNLNLILMLGRIDDADEVYLNGVQIGKSGTFYPYHQSAYDIERRYTIPTELLKKGDNVIAVKVLDTKDKGGIVSGHKIGIYYDNDLALISYDLSGDWKFSTYRQKDITNIDFDDSGWGTIKVPGYWEYQGFKGHNGHAWYRKEFTLSKKPEEENMFLILGRIDDYDKVYLNGKFIGSTEDLDSYSRRRRDQCWSLYRIYEIPRGLLQKNNVLAVEVNDWRGKGGIYEGPVGLATPQNAQTIKEGEGPSRKGSIIDDILQFLDINE